MQKHFFPKVRVGIGQKSHRFLPSNSSKPCVIGGVIFEDVPGLAADSDGDVIFHAICNGISSLTGVPILGGIALDLCMKDGITDSQVYLEKALETLGKIKIEHVALALEGKKPRIQNRIIEIRQKIAEVMKLGITQIGLTVTSGDGLTDFGCGDGLQCFCILSSIEM
ncbi:MAG: 2-C-methyl-D-erythritol 2,4-cyclodiphosphate synthase [Chlamydiae bacterium]|nr:2-C-methyl-D-erythritol 2,4-cyclodiphosphate synthase [Chlamydiota bacterium]